MHDGRQRLIKWAELFHLEATGALLDLTQNPSIRVTNKKDAKVITADEKSESNKSRKLQIKPSVLG